MFVLKSVELHLPWPLFGSCLGAAYAKDTVTGGSRCHLLPAVAHTSVSTGAQSSVFRMKAFLHSFF